jgi:cell division septation protein DedD
MSESMEPPPRPSLLGENDRPSPPPIMSEEPRRSSRGLTFFIAGFALVAFGGIVWYAYDQGRQTGSEGAAPLIRADSAPVRVRPEKPGGLKVPHQDMTIFGQLGKNGGSGEQSVERLLPRPEKPAPPPTPKAASTGEIPSAAVAVIPAPHPASVLNKPVGAPKQLLQPPKPVVSAKVTVMPKPPADKPAFKSAAKTSVKPISSGRFRVQIAAFKDEAAARRAWSRIQAAHKSELGGIRLTIERIRINGKGVFHRVQGGPLDVKQARAVCAVLKARNQACLVVRR